jgi:cytochrome c-type biogenesis protein CcmE
MTPTRKRRLIAVGLILLAVGAAAALTVLALSQNMTYLFSPSEVLAGHAPAGASFRLGGVVLEHSLQRDPSSLKVTFTVTDRFHDMPVEYTGILPDLFREGQSIVATGRRPRKLRKRDNDFPAGPAGKSRLPAYHRWAESLTAPTR